MLVDKGADVHAITKRKETTLMLASRSGQMDMLDLLIALKVDIDAKDEKGWTALHMAAFQGLGEVIKKLLTAGANVNATTLLGKTSLMIVSEFGCVNSVKINAKASLGQTALHYAALGNTVQTIEELLTAGANVDATSKTGETALAIASGVGNIDAVKVLTTKYNDILATDKAGMSAFHWAAFNNEVQSLKLLGVMVDNKEKEWSSFANTWKLRDFGNTSSIRCISKISGEDSGSLKARMGSLPKEKCRRRRTIFDRGELKSCKVCHNTGHKCHGLLRLVTREKLCNVCLNEHKIVNAVGKSACIRPTSKIMFLMVPVQLYYRDKAITVLTFLGYFG
ncbi:putative ankyrin repeat protein RF_0381 [Wyeomyia smithii]|uniref:putative ankyrin repeat protein RF_0381 n=1 Tax=Wyeomyia smithii TaxID=174621 RepID=UPI002467DC21|nr:putative ankyrin repeat protein RF_0381 [Wyeomyia smithii]